MTTQSRLIEYAKTLIQTSGFQTGEFSFDTPRYEFDPRATVYLADLNDYQAMNKVYASYLIALGGQRLRLSTPIHTRPSDLEKFFNVYDRVLGH